MRDSVVQGTENFDHLVFFNVPSHCTMHGPLPFRLQQNAIAAAGIEPATFGSAAECHGGQNSASHNIRKFCWLSVFTKRSGSDVEPGLPGLPLNASLAGHGDKVSVRWFFLFTCLSLPEKICRRGCLVSNLHIVHSSVWGQAFRFKWRFTLQNVWKKTHNCAYYFFIDSWGEREINKSLSSSWTSIKRIR